MIMEIKNKKTKLWRKQKYGEKAKLCSIDTGRFIVYIKTDDIYKDIAEDVETRYDTSNYELNRPLLKGKNKKVIDLMKDKLGGTVMKKLLGLKEKPYSCIIDGATENKKSKGIKKCIIKRKVKIGDYKSKLA